MKPRAPVPNVKTAGLREAHIRAPLATRRRDDGFDKVPIRISQGILTQIECLDEIRRYNVKRVNLGPSPISRLDNVTPSIMKKSFFPANGTCWEEAHRLYPQTDLAPVVSFSSDIFAVSQQI